jgi:hypothetical protein
MATSDFLSAATEGIQPVYETVDGITSPQQYTIAQIILTLNNGQQFDLKPFLVELSIYEDIFSSTISGYVMISDVRGQIENLNISGFNYLTLNYNKVGDSNGSLFSKNFRVYKIGERYQQNRGSEIYPIHFCSEERVLSQQIRIAKSYPNMLISDVISSILTDTIQTKKTLTIENSRGQFCFIVPNIRPFEAINWMSTYAQPENSSYVGADMIFYENLYGFNFRSIQSIITDDSYGTYNYSPQNVSQTSLDYNIYTILSYKFIQVFNTLETIADGGFANKVITLDPLLRVANTTSFNYNDTTNPAQPTNGTILPPYFQNAQSLNKYPLAVEMQNRLQQTVSQSYNSVVKILASNKHERQDPRVTASPLTLATTVPDIGAEVYIPNRTAQLSLINQIKLEVVVPGDPGLTVGRVVNLNLPNYRPEPSSKTAALDSYFSGNYIVTAVRHRMDIRGIYNCVMEVCSDSVSNSPIPPTNNSIVNS